MGYQQYGISPQLVERVKLKMKNPAAKERVKKLIEGVTKADLQNKAVVQRLVKSSAAILHEKLSPAQEEQLVAFVIGQRIDPKNTLHLIKLWGMFR
ncbi:stage VI sporulation protein F [Paenibacillus terreus]|uniref:Stage VI sporulation protein F n=1 Tax=Paenibacillus terreus TaxID=1387834 RepID=A0ABV5B3W2_9BACL